MSPLRQLANIISESVDKIEAELAKANLQYPDLDEPFNPTSPEEAASMVPAIRLPAALIVGACAQLSTIVNVPALSLYDAVGGFHITSGLRVAMEGSVAEILRGQSQGLHINDIAAKNGMDPDRLARVLRLLATHHIFIEVTPNVFKNNRLSSMLDTLKTVEEIKAELYALPVSNSPINKHTNTPGITALLEHCGDEMMKCSAYAPEILADPVRGSSEDPSHTPLSLAFKTDKHCFDWFEEPGNEFRLKRFASAMEGASRVDPPNAILSGFKWESLDPKTVVVDIGGGMGHLSLKIAQQHKDLRFVIQDRAPVIKEAEGFWKTNMPSALEDGTVTLEVHDFFTPQPKTDVGLFLCRMILHDYGKNRATSVLKNLRAAAGPKTKLLLVEQIVPYSCRGSFSRFGAKLHIEPPEPLLGNCGKATAISYLGDMQMLVAQFGEERTIGAFEELLKGAGWKIEDVFAVIGSIHSQILAVPV